MKSLLLASVLLMSSVFYADAQILNGEGQIHGSIEIDAQYYKPDSLIGAPAVPEKMLMNTYDQLDYTNGRISAGIRYEAYDDALQGYDPRYNGSGFPYKYIDYKQDNMEVTVGNYYEQFGSGLILRTYWSPQLGVDNSLNGVRVKYNPTPGVYLKGIIGDQRYYWTTGAGLVRGFDGEINLNELDSAWNKVKTKIIIGGSFVSKFQAASDPTFNYPENVGASAGRISIINGGFSFYTEGAYKINDPDAINNNIFKNGNAVLIRTGYSQKGFSLMLSGERIDNMSFKSDRTAVKNDLDINYLPTMPRDETYQLAAFYPYATQPNGEQGFDAEMQYKLPKGSLFGGKYGTNLDLEYSAVRSLDTTNLNDQATSDQGYSTKLANMGQTDYFQEVTFEIQHKFSPTFRMIAQYDYEYYDKTVIQDEAGSPNIISNVGVLDGYYTFSSSHTLHMELQGLQTEQDQGNWAFALAEYNFGSDWFLGALDEYNYGNSTPNLRIHYFTVTGGYTHNALRITIGYGKQRAGILCIGGVCRQIPASDGFSLSITNSF
ncbi:MAG TPA: DUF6029 family protein [Bacteroidia bacterium]|nr:DUF6029 family protein [Bacteroidia bacterium]